MINNKRCRTCNNNMMMMMCAFLLVVGICPTLPRMLFLSRAHIHIHCGINLVAKRSTFHKRQVVTSVCYCISQTKSSQKQQKSTAATVTSAITTAIITLAAVVVAVVTAVAAVPAITTAQPNDFQTEYEECSDWNEVEIVQSAYLMNERM